MLLRYCRRFKKFRGARQPDPDDMLAVHRYQYALPKPDEDDNARDYTCNLLLNYSR